MNKDQLKNETIQIYYIHSGSVDNGVFTKVPNCPPIATVAIVLANGLISRGVAVCSVNETFSRKEGRKLAIGRARKALYTKSDGLNGFDWSSDGWEDMAKSLKNLWGAFENAKGHYGNIINFKYLSEFSPTLTDYEIQLLEICNEKADEKYRREHKDMLFLEQSLNMTCVPV